MSFGSSPGLQACLHVGWKVLVCSQRVLFCRRAAAAAAAAAVGLLF